MKKLTQQAYKQAKAFLFSHGRKLDQQRFLFLLESGSAEAVLGELARYQNSDGGFGHALEPDLRTPASSAIATSQAFAIFRQVAAPASEPLVRRGVDYLLKTYDAEKAVWPIVPPAVEDAPHAPWWTYAEIEQNFGGFRINPTASLVGYLHDYPELAPADLLAQATQTALTRLEESADEIDMHDFQCFLALADAKHLPAAVRQRVETKLLRAAPATIEANPDKWTSYGLPPLDVAPSPRSLLTPVIDRQAIDANLDFVLDQQLPDGSWPIPWNWAFVDAQAWAQAERDWKGYQIVNRLNVLRAYGRIEEG